MREGNRLNPKKSSYGFNLLTFVELCLYFDEKNQITKCKGQRHPVYGVVTPSPLKLLRFGDIRTQSSRGQIAYLADDHYIASILDDHHHACYSPYIPDNGLTSTVKFPCVFTSVV